MIYAVENEVSLYLEVRTYYDIAALLALALRPRPLTYFTYYTLHIMQPRNTIFTSWELSEDEALIGELLSPQQQAVIQNDIALAAEQKALLKLDTTNVLAFAQKEAELQGTILTLQYLITRSNIAQERYVQGTAGNTGDTFQEDHY